VKRLTRTRFAATVGALVLLALLAAFLGVVTGPTPIGLGDVLEALRDRAASGSAGDIVVGIRLPRVLLALLVGASLAMSGVVFQALLHNPLADPYVLGISGGAALAGIAMLSLGAAFGFGAEAVPPAAFAGSALATLALYAIAGTGGRVSPTSLLLTGVVFNAFASAAIVFLASIAGLTEGARIFLWLIGNLGAAAFGSAWVVALFLGAGFAVALVLARSLNLLALGDETAEHLGVATEVHKRWLLAATALMVGAAVSVAGLVGFVGLIIPHLLRIVIGADHRLLVPSAALAGGAFLVVCDTVARTALGGRELPVGAITAIVGGPLFLWLLRRHHHRVLTP
jgi:iron complex transport system permease protein